MTERESLGAWERSRELIARWPVCPVCGKAPSTQIAHRIGQGKRNVKRYGKAVVHHEYNLVPVCGLLCNSRVAIDFDVIARSHLVLAIDDCASRGVSPHMAPLSRLLVAYEVLEDAHRRIGCSPE